MTERYFSDSANWSAYAVGKIIRGGRFKVRRIVWGRLMARSEKRKGEKIVRACIMIEDTGYASRVPVILE
jgi:hypothetical protein